MYKSKLFLFALASVGTLLCAQVEPLAFYKKCLVTSISGGPSSAIYTTRTNDGKTAHSDRLRGGIDPLIMEYGITNRLGLGFSRGGETYDVNINDFYNAKAPEGNKNMWTSTKYITMDVSYHPLVRKRIDLSVFGSVGYYTISGSWYNNSYSPNYNPATSKDFSFSYHGKGAVARAGARARIYVTQRLGVMGMVYAFNGYAKEKPKSNPVSDAPNNTGYSTMLSGVGAEFGVCFRLFKQKGVQPCAYKLNRIKKAREVKEEEEEDEKVPLFRLVWN